MLQKWTMTTTVPEKSMLNRNSFKDACIRASVIAHNEHVNKGKEAASRFQQRIHCPTRLERNTSSLMTSSQDSKPCVMSDDGCGICPNSYQYYNDGKSMTTIKKSFERIDIGGVEDLANNAQ
ncbi:hypothetical protein RB195_011827 [Necator americanus]|uniref:SCP domain-containing protein n=1 Tax=Necator americanus TaxID=51031 RepID=A0ABR1D5I0_NECAM